MAKYTHRFTGRSRWLQAAVIAAVGVAAALAGCAGQGPTTVGSAEGSPLSAQEFAVHVRLNRPAVEDRMRRELGIAQQENLDWDTKVGKWTAREILAQAAFDSLAEAKTVQSEAQKLGILQSVDYLLWQEARLAQNASNKQAAAAGETVYGLVEYDEDQFYQRTMSNLRIELEKSLGGLPSAPLYVSEEEAKARFEEDPQAWAVNGAGMRVEVLSFETPFERQQEVFDAVSKLAQSGDWSAIVAAAPTQPSSATLTLAGELFAEQRTDPSLIPAQMAEELYLGEVGGFVGPTSADGQVVMIRLSEKVHDAAGAFAQYSSRIRAAILDERLTEYLAQRQEDLAIEADMPAALQIVGSNINWAN